MRPPRFGEKPLSKFVKAKVYALARRVIPSVRERDRLERMIGPLGLWDQIQRYQIGFLKKVGLKPHHRLLDIGCGPLSGGLAFVDFLAPGNYVGVDVSEKAISEGYRQIAKAGLAGKNPKHEIRDSKRIRMTKSNCTKGASKARQFASFWMRISDLLQASDFMRRILSFYRAART